MKKIVIIIFQVLILISGISYSNIPMNMINYDFIKCPTFRNKEEKIQLISKKIQVNNIYRPLLQAHFKSISTKFLIHYDTTGINAVNNLDENKNSIPDYIDSVAFYFDRAYQIQVKEMGFIDLQSDSGKGGSDAIDIYVVESGKGKYGETFYGLTMNDLEIKPRKQVQRFTSFIVMDNDFSPNDSTILPDGNTKIQTFKEFGISAVKITSAHEFNHVLQFLYGEPNPIMPFINEMTSMLIEYEMYPESKDYLQFVNDFLKHPDLYPFSNDSASAGYRFTFFAIDLFNNFGINLFVQTWELIAQGINPYSALDSNLVIRGTNINNEYCAYMNSLYKASVLRDTNELPDANLLVKMKRFQEKEIGSFISESGNIKPYELRLYRFIPNTASDETIKDSLDIIFSTFKSSIMNTFDMNLLYNLNVSNQNENDEYINLANSDYYYKISFDSTDYCSNAFKLIGITINKISTAFPNPYSMYDNDGLLNIPVDSKSNAGDYAEYHIYNSAMKEIASGISQVVVQDKYLVIKLNINEIEGMGSGVYLFDTAVSGKKSFGKFIVIKR